jgi:hypothetical protein
VSPPRAGGVAALLLAAPHLIHPDWLLGTSPERCAGPGPWAGSPRWNATAGGVAKGAAYGAGDGAGRDAVPFAAATPVAPAVAGRLAAAVGASGARQVLACPAAPARSDELAVTIPADGARIHATLQDLGTTDALLVLPDLSAALLTTSAGFAVAAGPRTFAAAVAGADVRRARRSFGEFALASARSPAVLEAASYYGCALSGRPWRPAWLAWSRGAGVPSASGIGGQLAAMRQFLAGRLGAADFVRMFRAARRQEMWAGERAIGPLAAVLDTICWAVDGYVPPGEGWPAEHGQVDQGELREAVSVALRDL